MEAPNGAAPLGGAHAGIFRPPTSPSISSSIYLGKSPFSDLPASASNVKRKRYEPRSSAAFESYEAMDVDSTGGGRSQSGRSSAGRDARYTFAGSVETPHGAEHNRQLGYMDDSTYSDVDYRRALGSMRTTMEMPSCPKPSTTTSGPGWSMLALQTIGGVVGKVWDFCTVGAFRGFYAGGGRGYDVAPASSRGHAWCNEHDVPTLPELPGGFPAPDYAPASRTHEFTSPPAAKRRQVSGNLPNDELRKNWVMVEEPRHQGHSPVQIQTTQNRPVLHRRISKPVSRLGNSSLARETSRPVSHAGNPVLTNRQPASFASPRSAVAPERHVAPERPVTPSRLPVPSRPRSLSTATSPRLSQPSRIPSPSPYTTRGHRRTQSTASAASAAPARVRRRESSAQELVDQSSPRLDVRARNMVARRMQQEQETDERISDFNSRLMDMIRQGKEALGTTIEVDDYDDRMGTGNDPWEDD